MSTSTGLNVQNLVAIDTHVHIESHADGSDVNKAGTEIFRRRKPTSQRGGHRGILSRAQDGLRSFFRRRAVNRPQTTAERSSGGNRGGKQRRDDRVCQRRPHARAHSCPRGAPLDRRRWYSAGSSSIHPSSNSRQTIRSSIPFYEVLADAKLPVIFHTGHSGIGTGMRAAAASA